MVWAHRSATTFEAEIMKQPKKSQQAAKKQTTSKSRATLTGDAVMLLQKDHCKVEALFAQFGRAKDAQKKESLVGQICTELSMHMSLEEELFYPACHENDVEEAPLDEAQVEHDGAKTLMAELKAQSASTEFYDAKVKVLSEYIKHHVGEEEMRNGVFAKARKAGIDMTALGQAMKARKKS